MPMPKRALRRARRNRRLTNTRTAATDKKALTQTRAEINKVRTQLNRILQK